MLCLYTYSTQVRGLAIITEFMENGALNTFLAQRCTTLIPYQLLSFARGAAAGMLHLASQQPPILHRKHRPIINMCVNVSA